MRDELATPIDPDRPWPPHGRVRPGAVAAVALGGMLGASARYGVIRALPTGAGRFPWATFCANASGSFVLGVALGVLARFPPTRYLRPFVATGIVGAYTTMSTYLVETALLVDDGHAVTGAAYLLGSVGAGVALAYAGVVTARLARRPRRGAT